MSIRNLALLGVWLYFIGVNTVFRPKDIKVKGLLSFLGGATLYLLAVFNHLWE